MIDISLDEFRERASRGNLIPVTRTLLADSETPLTVYRKMRGQGESFLFESVEGGENIGRYSFVGCNPRGLLKQNGSQVEYWVEGGVAREWTIGSGGIRDGLEALQEVLEGYQFVGGESSQRFLGGAVGFLGYEFIHDVEPVVPRPPADDLGTPTMYFLLTDELLIFDRVSQTITIVVNAHIAEGQDLAATYQRACDQVDSMAHRLGQSLAPLPTLVPKNVPDLKAESNMSRERFEENVGKAKDYILAGDIIQVVGSQRFSTETKASPLDVYRSVRFINPSPYMFLLELDGFSLVGASPELHVRCDEQRVEIRPIAGTLPRGKNEKEDLANEKQLLADPKERAEHIMLVDLARNDIGRVCEFGSVKVRDLMIIERYSHVMHIVSDVEGKLDQNFSPYDLMRATFPAGTLSGAPKVRAMQIIAEMEQTARGPYGGCVGYFSYNGNLDCCITIRTALLKEGKAYFQAGGGWVHDSTKEGEYLETINKSKAMLKALSLAEALSKS